MRLRWWNERRGETWEQVQARMVAETSAYLTDALRHPEVAARIPVIEAGKGRFPPSLAQAFWEPILSE